METQKAFDLTLKKFDIKAKDIALKSGIGEHVVSRYRRGHSDILSNNAFKIIRALPLHARMYFLALCMEEENSQDLIAC